MTAAILACRGLAIGHGETTVARGIDCEVRPGELLVVAGQNGSGKSTLLHTIMGELAPHAGAVEFPAAGKRPRIALVPQADQIDGIYPFAVDEILGSASHSGRHVPREERHQALKEVGLAGFGRRLFHSLSGGERQRVLLARAFLARCQLYLLDEATSAVDVATEEALNRMLAEHLVREGSAGLAVSHRIDAIRRHASRILHLGAAIVIEDCRRESATTEVRA